MYETFFDLKTLPFKITPDPSFMYWDVAHKRAASVLAFGIEQLVPITVVTGDVGTGKTTLLQHFLEEAPRETTIGMLSNFWSGMGGLYQWILSAFDIRVEGSTVQQYRAFEDFAISEYAAGRRCVLIVDEAQNISDEDLEQLRMLTNINARKDCLVMLFLVGQPELRDRLKQPNNSQIAQRVGAAFHLGPMNLEDTGHYVRHRISVAGGTREIFDDGAIERVFGVSGGVPRLINVVCELALVTAFGEGVETIDAAYMDEFLAEAAETGLIAHLPNQPPTPVSGPPPRQTAKGPAGSPGSPSFRKSASLGTGKPSIRLVSDPWDTKETVSPDADPHVPAARTAEPAPEEAAETTAEPASQEPDGAPLSDDEALDLLSPEPVVTPEPQAESEQPREAAKDVVALEQQPGLNEVLDANLASALRQEPDQPPARSTVSRGVVARTRNNRVNVALIGVAVVVVFGAGIWILRETSSDGVADVPPSGTAPESTEAAQEPAVSDAPQDAPAQPENDAGVKEEPAADVIVATPSAGSAPETDHAVERDPEPVASGAIVLLDNPAGEALLESALTASISDPFAAVIDYSRAALRGEDQAAYYLGQLFETGVDVPRDIAAARAWYEHAQSNVRSARRRLAGLEAVESTGPLAAAMPLLGGQLPDGTAEFVWSGGVGAAPEYFVVEMAAAPDAPIVRLAPTGLTAVSIPDIGDEQVWRVLAVRPASSDYVVSNWYAMGQAGEPVSTDAGPVRPEVSVGGTEADTINAAVAALTAAGISVTSESFLDAANEGGVVRYAYDADRPAAEQVISLLGNDLELEQIPAEPTENRLILPGQLSVVLN
ncbi:AAA family ATPase [Sedimentitalea todarodis]|uniref:AAA family ATPase n=1 Tax=Sedimentitalea todarodis TaxID=1631240 RepID=A0ABU3V7Y2_9RHOB|nr:AAA family ATPase [Sedimentitalea todarodis]MDU9002277.1 AAA family ATPase [Sedimentitalea todarodis]